jgi:hypothetical protein
MWTGHIAIHQGLKPSTLMLYPFFRRGRADLVFAGGA